MRVCENANAVMQCNFKNIYAAITQRKVCSCAPIFKFYYGPQDFILVANLYQAHVLRATTVKFGVRVRIRDFHPRPNFYRNRLMGYVLSLGAKCANNYKF